MKNNKLTKTLLERFGEPIGDTYAGIGVKDERHKDESIEEAITCEACGAMVEVDSDVCHECGMMPLIMGEEEINQVAPPGMEKVVKALKKKGDVENPWAVAWSMYKKKHKK